MNQPWIYIYSPSRSPLPPPSPPHSSGSSQCTRPEHLFILPLKHIWLHFSLQIVFPRGSVIKNPPASAGFTETRVQSLGREDLPEEGRATDSSSLAWRIPWTEEPGGLQSTVWQRVEHGWSDLAYIAHVSMNGFVYSCVCCLSCPSPVENGNIT